MTKLSSYWNASPISQKKLLLADLELWQVAKKPEVEWILLRILKEDCHNCYYNLLIMKLILLIKQDKSIHYDSKTIDSDTKSIKLS